MGYDLYLELLQSTVADLQNQARGGQKDFKLDIDPEIHLKMNAYLPDSYIPDTAQRYHMYQRIAAAGSRPPEELDDLQAELVDRYGLLPQETINLLTIIAIKGRLRQSGITKLEQAPDCCVFSFVREAPIDPQVILDLISKTTKNSKKVIRLTPDNRLVVPIQEGEHVIATVERILTHLEQ